MRIYSNYNEKEYELMVEASKKVGLSLSAYQKYCSLLGLNNTNNFLMPDLIQEMLSCLNSLKQGVPFIVSSLLPEKWVSLTRSQKISLSKQLANEIKASPSVYKKIGILNGSTSQYIKL